MLSLSRFPGEKIIITVPPSDKPTIIEHVTGEVRMGGSVRQRYAAPPGVTINRSEIQQRVDAEAGLSSR